jgi:hypothetical protein
VQKTEKTTARDKQSLRTGNPPGVDEKSTSIAFTHKNSRTRGQCGRRSGMAREGLQSSAKVRINI